MRAGFPAGESVRRNLRREGDRGEELAVQYLTGHGYRILERNFRFRRTGEIDIIARDGEDLVFCEVKMRTTETFGTPEDAVTPMKQETIRRVAAAYLATRGLSSLPCRFDVVAILFREGTPEITLYRNAF